MSFHNTLTPFLGEEATEYAPEYETTTEFMNAKFQEVLDNTVANKEAIESIEENMVSQTKVEITASMLKNGWGNYSGYKARYIETPESITFTLMITGGVKTKRSIICEGLPIGVKAMMMLGDDKGRVYPCKYVENGTITLMDVPVESDALWLCLATEVVKGV